MQEISKTPLCMDCGDPLSLNKKQSSYFFCETCNKTFSYINKSFCSLCYYPLYNHSLTVRYNKNSLLEYPFFYCCSNPECKIYSVAVYSNERFGIFWDGMEQVQITFNYNLTKIEKMNWAYFSTRQSDGYPVKEKIAKKHFLKVFRINLEKLL